MKIKTVNTYYARMKGLLGTSQHQLEFDALHLIPCRGVHTFGMKYPLDLAFLDGRGEVIACKRNVPPSKVFSSPRGTRSVLERPADPCPWLKPGDYIESGQTKEKTMNMMKTCPICAAKAVKGARICYECYYRFSDQSTRDVAPADLSACGAAKMTCKDS